MEDINKGGVGSGRKPEFKSSYGDGVYSKKENAISAGKHLVKPHNYTMIEHDGKHIVTTNARASNFIKEYGSKRVGKFFSNGNFVHEGHNPLEAMKHDGIEKGGEGSKGGKVIGHTKSGKPIYKTHGALNVAYGNFSAEDHKDAASAHNKLAYHHDNEKMSNKDHLVKLYHGTQVELHSKAGNLHEKQYEKMSKMKKSISIEDYHTEDAKTNPHLVKSFKNDPQVDVRKTLDDKLSKGLIDNDLHGKAIAQLDVIVRRTK